MNVRITPRGQPQRTDLYGGIHVVTCDDVNVSLVAVRHRGQVVTTTIPKAYVAELALDEDPGDFF